MAAAEAPVERGLRAEVELLYRMRGHRARLAQLRAAVNHPSQGEEFS